MNDAFPRRGRWYGTHSTILEVLKASIPGCESLEKLSDNQMKAIAAVKLGPISARFTGNVLLSEIDAPNSYRISGEGQGGVAGFAKGGAAVKLTDDGGGHLAELPGQRPGRRQACATRCSTDRCQRQADGGYLLRSLQQGGAGNVSGGTNDQPTELAGASTTTRPVAAVASGRMHRPAIPIWALIPREPFGLPLAAWIGGAFSWS